MDSADYLLFAVASLVTSLICFASPVFGWMWRGDWTWPGWTIGSLLHPSRQKSAFRTNAFGLGLEDVSGANQNDAMARYSVGWLFLALALVLLVAAGLEAASVD